MEKTIEKFNNVALTISKKIKKDEQKNPYSYMVLSSSSFFAIFLTIIDNAKPEGFDFTFKDRFVTSLKKLSNKKIEKLYKVLLMEYFPFIEHSMITDFKNGFPEGFESFKENFIISLNLNENELKIYKETSLNYDSGYHARKLLELMDVPKNIDDLFLVETIEEIKPMIFHQINKNIFTFIQS